MTMNCYNYILAHSFLNPKKDNKKYIHIIKSTYHVRCKRFPRKIQLKMEIKSISGYSESSV